MLTTPQSAEVFVASLHEKERVLLREALRINDQTDETIGKQNSVFAILLSTKTLEVVVSSYHMHTCMS